MYDIDKASALRPVHVLSFYGINMKDHGMEIKSLYVDALLVAENDKKVIIWVKPRSTHWLEVKNHCDSKLGVGFELH